MPREVDKRKTAKALRRLKRAAERAETGDAKLTDWEKEFVSGVRQRLETYGSAFRDPGKGRLEEALSARQTQVTRTIEKKTRPKLKQDAGKPEPEKPRPRSSFKRKAPVSKARSRDINEDVDDAPAEEAPARRPVKTRPVLKVIPGGAGPRTKA
jgi:hypothetical protein